MLPKATRIEYELAQRHQSLLIHLSELQCTLSDERAETVPRTNVVTDLARRLKHVQAQLDALGARIERSGLNRISGDIAGDQIWRSRMQVGQAALQYHVTDRFVFAFFIPEVGPIQLELLRPNTDELFSMVHSYARKLGNPRLPWKQTSTELYVELLSPFDHLIGDLEHLFVIPSSFLHKLPFSTLWDPRSGKFLYQRVPHSLVPHVNLIGLTPISKSPPSALALGISRFSNTKLDPLSLGEAEASKIREILGDSTQLLLGSKNKATREYLFSEFPRHRIVHLSTHGIPDRRPMLSHLVLKRDDGTDNNVTGLELLELKRPEVVQLVVLSACDTGKVQAGMADDILGLPRAFLLAGSDSVLATLWSVEQVSTAELIVDFYSALKSDGMSVSEALGHAQLETAASPKWQHPHFWGAWIVIGDGTLVLYKTNPFAPGHPR
ncbi:MAG: CHAT domain-containing protein [Desulfobacteraceae bacterium]|nr:CHAT domain-containing protein [Desulfobacteraceae bacterium]